MAALARASAQEPSSAPVEELIDEEWPDNDALRHAHAGIPDGLASEPEEPSVTSPAFLATGRHVQVYTLHGFCTRTRMKALIDLPPEEVLAIMQNSDNTGIMRTLKEVKQHVVISETPDETCTYAEHVARTGPRFMQRTIQLNVGMKVRPHELSGEFSLAKPGGVRVYEGSWTITPVQAVGHTIVTAQSEASDDGVSHSSGEAPHEQSVLSIEQDTEPFVPPRAHALQGLVRGLIEGVNLREMTMFLEDVDAVVALRKAGVPLATVLSAERSEGRALLPGQRRRFLGLF